MLKYEFIFDIFLPGQLLEHVFLNNYLSKRWTEYSLQQYYSLFIVGVYVLYSAKQDHKSIYILHLYSTKEIKP